MGPSLPLVLGHRGARRRAPENTLRAFELALEEGAAGVELDVHQSADGVVVVHHDPTLVDAAGTTVALSSLTGRQIIEARSGAAQIPTLEQVLLWQDTSGAILNVELKGDGPSPLALAEAVARLLAGRERLILSSFHPLIVRSLAEACPDTKVALLVESTQALDPKAPRALGTRAIHPHHSWLTESSVRALRAEGIELIGTWTVNDPERAIALADLGIDILISDVPGQILTALSSAAPK